MLLPIKTLTLQSLRLTQTRLFATKINQISKANLQIHFSSEPKTSQEEDGKEKLETFVIDVRNPIEIALSGRLDEKVINIPLSTITHPSFLSSDHEEFKTDYNIPHPLSPTGKNSRYIFSCKAGVRSMVAAEVLVGVDGGGEIVNYPGGSNEWFS